MGKAVAALIVIGAWGLFGAPAPAAGQTEGADGAASSYPTFLAAYRFHLNAARLVTNHVAFDWATEFGGDVDLVDFGWGRVNGLVNFETILGHERGAFDPTQGNYTLAVRLDWRARGTNLGAVFHHVSRHLSDRAKAFPIDWNMVGLVARRQFQRGAVRLDTRSHLLAVTKRSFVDYRTEFGLGVMATQPVRPRATVFTGGEVVVRRVARSVFGRGALVGARFESGLRLAGTRAGLDLFVAVERRIDADPVALGTPSWALFGFRIVNP